MTAPAWGECLRISELPDVDEAIRGHLADPNEDSAVCMVRAILEAQDLASLLPGTQYMDPPDGGSVTIMEQLQRMAEDAARWRQAQTEGVKTYQQFIIQSATGLPHWEDEGYHRTLESAKKALPYYVKQVHRKFRVLHRTEQIVMDNAEIRGGAVVVTEAPAGKG